jgi:hypothetical protein
LLPFELRYLARATTGTSPHRSGPDRWVIDISTPTSNLLGPRRFIEIPNPEDRLWVNAEHVPLFIEHGWNTHPRHPASPISSRHATSATSKSTLDGRFKWRPPTGSATAALEPSRT